MRAEWIVPRFAPVVMLGAFPLASVALGIQGLRSGGPRGRHALLLGVAVLELVWAVLASAMIGFAIAGRSG